MARYAASVQYDGAQFYGWQLLKTGLPTVQEAVEKALSKVANHPVSVICAGRTDARVHGCNQIIHFDTDAVRTKRGWVYGANANLPDSVAINWVKPIDNQFHARFSAQWRRYRYVIYNHPIRPVHLVKGVTWNYRPLDVRHMQQAGQCLIGQHDFTSFRAIQCQAKSPVRDITRLNVTQHGPLIVIDIQANAFLHHMVRNIAGVLMTIGCGKRPVKWAQQVLEARNRTQGGVTASPCGLYFVDVGYPEQFDLPKSEPNPLFIAPLLPL